MTDWAARAAARVARAVNFRRGELPLGALAALFYFCVLCGYFFLRPVREAMGVARGMDELRWLFVVTSIVALVLMLLFGGVVSRLDRRRFIPIGYLFVIGCLMAFAVLLALDAVAGGGIIGTDTETALARSVGYTFYIWLSVINLFVNSLFWAFMVDIFNVDQGKRMFAFIGMGGTVGALAGGWTTNFVSGLTESIYLPVGLMLTGAAFFAAAIAVMLTLDRVAVGSEHSRLGRREGSSSARGRSGAAASVRGQREAAPRATPQPLRADSQAGPQAAPGERIGGDFLEGAMAVATSPYLLGIAVFIVFLAISNTLIYFTQANIIIESTDTFSQSVAAFAQFDFLAQAATLVTQIFITTRLIRRLGVGWTLAILPLVTVAGFAILAIWPLYGVMALFQALHRATRYAISRPARETLFSVVPPAEKYKAKPLIDVFLYRGGDVAGAGIQGALSALGTITLMAAATVPFAAVWCALSIALGRAQQRRDPAAQEPAAGSGAGRPMRARSSRP